MIWTILDWTFIVVLLIAGFAALIKDDPAHVTWAYWAAAGCFDLRRRTR